MTIYVIHHGYGTDGGFGDYSPPYWSAYPLEVDGRTVWFDNEPEAMEAVAKLNIASRDAFYNAGKGGSYTGDFPLEYEYRAINPVHGPVCDASTAIALVTEVHGEAWAESQWGDVYCCDSGDCEECMEGLDE